MKQLLLTLTLCFLALNIALAQNDNRFDKANQLFQDENYSGSIALYEEILSSGKESGSLYFNLGNAYYKQGKLPQAILNYERAKLMLPHDKDIAYNLKMANSQITDKLETVGEFFLATWLSGFRNSTKSDTWALISIISFVLALGLLAVFMFSNTKSIKQASFYIAIIFIATCMLSLSFSYGQKNELTNRNFAIIFTPSVTIKSSPSTGGTELFILHEGTKVKILETVGEWHRIQISDGNDGWLPISTIEVI